MSSKQPPPFRGSRAKDFLVNVTRRADASMQGMVTHLISQQSREFRSLLELIRLISDRLDEMGMPVSGVKLRTWPDLHLTLVKKGENKMDEKPAARDTSKVGDSAFLVRVMFRQNATWMGEIHWLNGEKKLYFRSMMEMLMLMQEALDKSGTPPAEYSFRTWQALDDASLQEGK